MDADEVVRVKVTVGGAEYVLRGRQSSARLQEIAKLVDGLMQAVSEANPNLDTKRVAVLAALNIAEQMYELRDQYEELLTLLEEQTNA